MGKAWRTVSVPIEFADLLVNVRNALVQYPLDVLSIGSVAADMSYWDKTNVARETYRASVLSYFSGETKEISPADLVNQLDMMISKVVLGIGKAIATTDRENAGISPTYFWYECDSYEIIPPTVHSVPPPPTQVVSKAFVRHEVGRIFQISLGPVELR